MSPIRGIGTDLVSIERIEKLWTNYHLKFAQRILSTKELESFASKEDKVGFLAKRFAAKEAIAKALGTGIGKTISFHDMSILNHESGEPFVQFSVDVDAWFKRQTMSKVFISLSDEKAYALAFCIIS